MEKRFFKDALLWGFILWLVGYLLGIVLFFIVPKGMIGYIITPIGIVITLWVLARKIKGKDLRYYYLGLAVIWTLIAILGDYLFNVKLFNIGSAYYQADIYFYYMSTFLLPLVYWFAKRNRK